MPTTTNVSTTVIDGAIRNALVCVDKNSNGQCDAGEVQGTTDASGNVTLAVPNADVGKYPMLAIVGTNAIDADNGPVTTAYALSAPADQTAVVSPLTTLVQQTVASTGISTAEAAKSVQAATGITASLFADFTKAAAPAPGSVNPASIARMVVVTTQQQATAIAGTLGTTAIDGATITRADLDKAIQKKLLELLPALVSALRDAAVTNPTTGAIDPAALLAAATNLVSSAGLTPAAVATVVAINTQASTQATPTTRVATAGFSLDTLVFTDASNYSFRTLGSSLAQDTPDAGNKIKFVERRQRSAAGAVAKWSSGNDPWRNADLSWNGTAWVACPINFENTSTVRDAAGNSSYVYCNGRETGTTNRATFDIAGKTLAAVYAQATAAGFSNVYVADPAALGSATFPADSKLFYQTSTPLTEAVSYYPAGANSAPGFSNVVSQYSAAVSAGGTASAQAPNVACNSTETAGNGSSSTTLEGMIASKTGTPCIFAQNTVTYNGVTYTGDTVNEWWGNSTVGLGTIGSVSTAPTAGSSGYYTGNTLLRVAFTGNGTNPVTYYACKQRYVNGSTRNCTAIGSGSYTITALGDARALTLTNPPPLVATLNYNPLFVERGGFVYFGYQSKPRITNKARLNTVAATALLGQLALVADGVSVPMLLTPASYQGSWDIREASLAVGPSVGTSIFVGADGNNLCYGRSTAQFFACTVTITDPATGAFTRTTATGTLRGTFDFMAGSAAGTYSDPTASPADGSFVGARR